MAQSKGIINVTSVCDIKYKMAPAILKAPPLPNRVLTESQLKYNITSEFTKSLKRDQQWNVSQVTEKWTGPLISVFVYIGWNIVAHLRGDNLEPFTAQWSLYVPPV
jgi:hypothetical protein